MYGWWCGKRMNGRTDGRTEVTTTTTIKDKEAKTRHCNVATNVAMFWLLAFGGDVCSVGNLDDVIHLRGGCWLCGVRWLNE